MTEAAASLDHRSGRSRWRRAWDVLRGRENGLPPRGEGDESVSFAELVWAHDRRQQVLDEDGHNKAEKEYRRRLRLFKLEHGTVLQTYWCRYEVSGIALTELQRPRRLTNLFRRDSVLAFHTATDWRTGHARRIESALHEWESMAIRVAEVLRETSERIALYRIFAASARLLAFVDRKAPAAAATDPGLDAVLAEHQRELAEVEAFYIQAGENSARIVFFRGMVIGTLSLAALVGGGYLLGWWFGWLESDRESTYTLFVSIAMGAVGAVLSVMTRMKRRDGWSLEWEVGRKSVRFLGAIRPWIGALFAFVIYLALKSELIDVLVGVDKSLYFYATIAFLAGFSERWAQVLLGRAFGEIGEADDGGKTLRPRRTGPPLRTSGSGIAGVRRPPRNPLH